MRLAVQPQALAHGAIGQILCMTSNTNGLVDVQSACQLQGVAAEGTGLHACWTKRHAAPVWALSEQVSKQRVARLQVGHQANLCRQRLQLVGPQACRNEHGL